MTIWGLTFIALQTIWSSLHDLMGQTADELALAHRWTDLLTSVCSGHAPGTAASEFLSFSPRSHYLGHNVFNFVELCEEFISGKTGCPIARTIFQHLSNGFTCLLQHSRYWHTLH